MSVTFHLHSHQQEKVPDIDVFGEETEHVISIRNDIGAQVRSDLCHDPAQADEERSAASGWTIPLSCKNKWIPDILSIDNLGGAARYDTA